jgi:hypothetical protein
MIGARSDSISPEKDNENPHPVYSPELSLPASENFTAVIQTLSLLESFHISEKHLK